MTLQDKVFKTLLKKLEQHKSKMYGYELNLPDIATCKKALEKQIPKKPKYKTTCAKCGTHNSVWGKLANPKGHPIVYCWNCGQANEIDWEEGGTSD